MAFKKFRNMKVYEQSGYNYKSTPTIMLKGQWLKEAGFNVGDSITVTYYWRGSASVDLFFCWYETELD